MKTLIRFLIKIARSMSRRWTKFLLIAQLKSVGKNFICDQNVKIYGGENITLGNNVVLNKDVILQSCDGAKIEIENNVTISYGAKIITGNLSSNSVTSKNERSHDSSSITIKSNVWIGANVIILPGVIIKKNIIIGAGSVVTRSLIEGNAVYAGTPAKFVKSL